MDLRYKLGLDGSQFDAQARSSTGLVGKMGAGLAALGAGAAFGSLLRRGFEFNKTMSDSVGAIAAVLSQFQGLNDEAAKGEAVKAIQQIKELAPKTAGTLSSLVEGFLATLASAQSAGISVQQNIDLVGRFANALAAAKIPAEQLAQEMRSILTGNIGADSTLAKTLNITNEAAKAALDAGKMYEFLVWKIGRMANAGDTASVAFSSLEDAVEQAAGALTAASFEHILTGAKSLTEQVAEMTPQLKALGEGMGWLAEKSFSLMKGFSDLGQYLGAYAAAVQKTISGEMEWNAAVEDSFINLDRLQRQREEDTVTATKQTKANQEGAKAFDMTALAASKAAKSMDSLERARKAGQMTAARDDIMGEIERLKALAGGRKKAADEIDREMRIRRDMLQIIQQTGATEEQARKLATQKADLEDRVDGKRRKIRGVQGGGRLMGQPTGPLADITKPLAGGGMQEFEALQKISGSMKTSIIPGNKFMEPNRVWVPNFLDPLSGRKATPVGGSKAAERVSRLMGGSDMSGRVNAATAPASAPEGGKGAKTADPMLAELQGIRQELTRIRTA
jgi:hypothetical protein